MEKHVKNIYYVGIEEAEGKTGKKELPIYRQMRFLPYADGQIQIYFSLLPKKLLIKKTLFKRNNWVSKLERTIESAQMLLNAVDGEMILFSEELEEKIGEKREIPQVLYAVCLKLLREGRYHTMEECGKNACKIRDDLQLETLTVSLPEESGPITEENLIFLLLPYLSRINSVVFCGEETESAGRIETYLYDEYGILTSYSKRPEKNTVWIDLNENTDLRLGRFASENGIYHLNRTEVLKFLDTIVKNGYNTEVN